MGTCFVSCQGAGNTRCAGSDNHQVEIKLLADVGDRFWLRKELGLAITGMTGSGSCFAVEVGLGNVSFALGRWLAAAR